MPHRTAGKSLNCPLVPVAEAVFVLVRMPLVTADTVALTPRLVRVVRPQSVPVRTAVFALGHGRTTGEHPCLALVTVA